MNYRITITLLGIRTSWQMRAASISDAALMCKAWRAVRIERINWVLSG
jgi:hypothetical protein